jgi:hypothetical protein
MDRDGFKQWLDRYVDAWRLNDPAAVGDLFSAEARYAYDPFDEALVGRTAIVASWLTEPDVPGTWEADYEDRTAVDREFANVFVCRFDAEGRCREFTEWYMRRRPEAVPD